MEIKPIAYIMTDFKEKFGIPRQSGRAPSLTGRIIFEPEYRAEEALRGIEAFSHLWLIFDFSEAHREKWSPTVRPPRLGGNMRVGVFASRSPFRPNPIGLSSVELVGVEKTGEYGLTLIVKGADLLDNTPILDIKPYIAYTDSHPNARCGYADKFAEHKLKVEIPAGLYIPDDKRASLIECLADDPRPSYHDDPERIYGMSFAGFNIRFRIHDGICEVLNMEENKNDKI